MYFRADGRDERQRYQYNYLTAMQYLKIKCSKKNPAEMLEKYGIKTIAVYGLGDLGKCLVEDLLQGDISIRYIIDQACQLYPAGYQSIPVISLDEAPKQAEVDAVINTVIYEQNKIIDGLMDRGGGWNWIKYSA